MALWRAALSFPLLVALMQPQPACDSNPPPDGGEPPPVGDTFTAADGTRFLVEVYARNLVVPWALAFAPDGRVFVSERPGRVRIIRDNQVLTTPALTLGDVYSVGESGLLGIALHPDFASNRFVYLVYTASTPRGIVNRVVRYRELNDQLGERAILLDDIPAADIHDGSRVKFGPDGRLYVTMGDANVRSRAQSLSSLSGKILRLNADGTTPAENPFSSEIYSYGHRNPQGIDWHPVSGELWETEHGPTGFDEVNRIRIGRNYGWPEITGSETAPNMERPVLFYTPSVAPSGAAFYRGTLIPNFTNNLFFGTLAGRHLHRVRLDPANPARVAGEERLLENRYGRIREVVFGPDGFLYFTTSNRDGRATPGAEDDRILRIRPAATLISELGPSR
jgi:glucose/arabinose dehydrogenase